ncbi:MAG: hypothetical protein HOI53_08545 [Francisellaceae bacterium]|nr:hypothetical protein [Francisellaceae bacterium]MBT6208064.1 hypothetical protein [Francisellaceae bacterium]MBT6538798.1 hypothetical protein [Francisellaceae bacterium]
MKVKNLSDDFVKKIAKGDMSAFLGLEKNDPRLLMVYKLKIGMHELGEFNYSLNILEVACLFGQLAVVRRLLSKEKDTGFIPNVIAYAIGYLVADNGFAEELLTESGNHIYPEVVAYTTKTYSSVLTASCLGGNLDVIDFLLSKDMHGAYTFPQIVNSNNHVAISVAARHESDVLINRFLSRNREADEYEFPHIVNNLFEVTNCNGKPENIENCISPIAAAVKFGSVMVVKRLLRSKNRILEFPGADHYLQVYGEDLLHISYSNKDFEMFNLIGTKIVEAEVPVSSRLLNEHLFHIMVKDKSNEDIYLKAYEIWGCDFSKIPDSLAHDYLFAIRDGEFTYQKNVAPTVSRSFSLDSVMTDVEKKSYDTLRQYAQEIRIPYGVVSQSPSGDGYRIEVQSYDVVNRRSFTSTSGEKFVM